MKTADLRVYVAFLMGEKDDVILTNAKRLMAKRQVNENELHVVKVSVELSMDPAEPTVVGAEATGVDVARLKQALGHLTGLSELVLLGHGGKRLFAGMDGETLFKTLKDWGFKASCRVNVVSCKSAGEVAPASVESILDADSVSWARDFHRRLLNNGQRCEMMARIGSTWVNQQGQKLTGIKSSDPKVPDVKNHHDPRGKVRFFYQQADGNTLTQRAEFAHYSDQ